MQESSTKTKWLLLLGLILIISGVIAYMAMTKKTASKDVETPSTVSRTYKDGTYSATGQYLSPAGPETVGISLTLKDNIIVDTEIEVHATNPGSKMMQDVFAANYKVLVIGKNIDEVKLTKVSGSSLTPAGFNDAALKIKAQAQS